jgi:hypothetical protein
MNMNDEKISALLSELESILRKQGENNWIRGIKAALDVLDEPNGVDQARSIYSSMNRGVGSFADYNVWIDDFNARMKANQDVDRLRAQLWTAFGL